jgi:23S rRNA U2552 (ribose-2'-O)-methylase RlmE/FtsJ
MNTETLPSLTYSILVTRAYADRVRDKLLGLKSEWTQLERVTSSCRIIPTEAGKGGRKERRGYTLLILQGVISTDALQILSPIARQNISSGHRLTHRVTTTTSTCLTASDLVGPTLYKLLVTKASFDTSDKQHALRVDCFPKEDTEAICLALQRAAASADDDPGSIQPYEGIISMTRSASKATHTLHLIRDDMDVSNSCYWIGLEQNNANSEQEATIDIKFNDNAAKEVIIEPVDQSTGKNLSPTPLTDPDAPVSRAYYKLHQVWDEVLDPLFSPDIKSKGTAFDLGAAPGGWTQICRHHFPRVVAVDPGNLGGRIVAKEGVHHVVAELSSVEVATALQKYAEAGPLSLLVCDASTDSNEVLDRILTLLKRLQTTEDCTTTTKWTVPSAFVVTLKLPYKTVGSLARNLTKVVGMIPQQLATAVNAMSFDTTKSTPIVVRFQVVHLMANSESERTLIAVFDHEQQDP